MKNEVYTEFKALQNSIDEFHLADTLENLKMEAFKIYTALYNRNEITPTNLSFDSLQNLLHDMPIISLKMQTSLPLNFIQNNKPQSSTSVEMDYVFNPVFSSQNIDSTDKQTEKELFDALQELSTKKELYNAKLQEIQQKKEENKVIQAEYNKALKDLNSTDLSAKEMAMKSIQKLKSSYENSLNNVPVFPENFTALNNKIAFLKSKIHIVKT